MGGKLATVADLKALALKMSIVKGAQYPGPLTHAWLYYIEETQCAGVIYNSKLGFKAIGWCPD